MKTTVFRFFPCVFLTALVALTGCEKAGDEVTPVSVAATEPIEGHPDDWCGGHALPESMCTKCNPELKAKFEAKGDWCATHGFPESACPVCNPMKAPQRASVVGDPSDWCDSHGLPESKCAKCNPELAAKYESEGDWCAAHGQPESVCPVCNPATPPSNK